MESHFSNHSSNHQPGRLLVAGGCANWTTLVAPLVDYGFQVEMVSDVERAGIRCVEQVVDAVVIDLNQQIDGLQRELLRRSELRAAAAAADANSDGSDADNPGTATAAAAAAAAAECL